MSSSSRDALLPAPTASASVPPSVAGTVQPSPRSSCSGDDGEEVCFVVRGENLSARIKRSLLTEESSPVLLAMIADRGDDPSLPRGERDSQGRYILEGPTNRDAFSFLVESVKRGGSMTVPEMADWLPDLASRMEACRNVDFYLLPGQTKVQLTKLLLSGFVGTTSGAGSSPSKAAAAAALCYDALPLVDISQLGLCRSEMILEKVHLEGLNLRALQLENSHIKSLVIQNCQLVECDLALSVTAGEVRISRSRVQKTFLGVFSTKVVIEDRSEVVDTNIRVVEALAVHSSTMRQCSFQGSPEDRKERQVVSVAFVSSALYGDVRLPFDRITCEDTLFHGDMVQMTKTGATLSFAKTKIKKLPNMQSEGQVHLCLEDCQLTDAITFHKMKLGLRNVSMLKPCEFDSIVFWDKVVDIVFPAQTNFRLTRFKEGLHGVIASGCTFDGCNFGFSQNALSDCLLTQCTFRNCRFPFLEEHSPVANLAGGSFAQCRIQWSGQFAHEESFVINSHWLRKWNLAGASLSEGPA